jgi:hypothetical protein
VISDDIQVLKGTVFNEVINMFELKQNKNKNKTKRPTFSLKQAVEANGLRETDSCTF